MIAALNNRREADRSNASNAKNQAAEQLNALLEQSQQATAAADQRAEELSNKLALAEEELEPLKKIRGQFSILQTQSNRLQNAKDRVDGENENLTAENYDLLRSRTTHHPRDGSVLWNRRSSTLGILQMSGLQLWNLLPWMGPWSF